MYPSVVCGYHEFNKHMLLGGKNTLGEKQKSSAKCFKYKYKCPVPKLHTFAFTATQIRNMPNSLLTCMKSNGRKHLICSVYIFSIEVEVCN